MWATPPAVAWRGCRPPAILASALPHPRAPLRAWALPQVSTLVLRSSTSNRLDDLQRAVEDGVNNYKQVHPPAGLVGLL